MVVTFAIFASLPIIDFKEMGIGLAAAVLIDATIVRAVLFRLDEALGRPQLVPAELARVAAPPRARRSAGAGRRTARARAGGLARVHSQPAAPTDPWMRRRLRPPTHETKEIHLMTSPTNEPSARRSGGQAALAVVGALAALLALVVLLGGAALVGVARNETRYRRVLRVRREHADDADSRARLRQPRHRHGRAQLALQPRTARNHPIGDDGLDEAGLHRCRPSVAGRRVSERCLARRGHRLRARPVLVRALPPDRHDDAGRADRAGLLGDVGQWPR